MIKFSFWQTLPHKVLVLGHHSDAEARKGLQDAQAMFDMHENSDKHHPLTLHFFQGSLAADVQRFLAGEIKRQDSFALMQEAAACAFVPAVERSIEARHALLKAKTAVMKRARPATFSLALRSHELHRRCFQNQELLVQWENHVQSLKSVPKTGLPVLLHRVGFAQHPNVLRLQGLGQRVRLRDVAYMIYHADIETMYELRAGHQKSMSQPRFRDNPDAADKLHKLVHVQEDDQGKHSLMLRILMMEHFRQKCSEGEIYSVSGALPEARYLQDALIPGRGPVGAAGAQQAQSSRAGFFAAPDVVEPLIDESDGRLSPGPAAADDPQLFVQASVFAV